MAKIILHLPQGHHDAVAIEITQPFPDTGSVHEKETIYRQDAERLGDALLVALPIGTLEYLMESMQTRIAYVLTDKKGTNR